MGFFFEHGWENTHVTCAIISIFLWNTLWYHRLSRGETKYIMHLYLVYLVVKSFDPYERTLKIQWPVTVDSGSLFQGSTTSVSSEMCPAASLEKLFGMNGLWDLFGEMRRTLWSLFCSDRVETYMCQSGLKKKAFDWRNPTDPRYFY